MSTFEVVPTVLGALAVACWSVIVGNARHRVWYSDRRQHMWLICAITEVGALWSAIGALSDRQSAAAVLWFEVALLVLWEAWLVRPRRWYRLPFPPYTRVRLDRPSRRVSLDKAGAR